MRRFIIELAETGRVSINEEGTKENSSVLYGDHERRILADRLTVLQNDFHALSAFGVQHPDRCPQFQERHDMAY
jgi:hypothetical protein